MTTAAKFNDAVAEAFAEKMLGAINNSALVLMTSLGHRTGLFDVMSKLPPSTSLRVAEAAGLDERYVREWLGAMVTGRVVDYDPEGRTYFLPPEHAAFLTRAASPNNMAVTTQFIAVLGAVEDRIVDAFRDGGGVPYSAYDRFHEVMAWVVLVVFFGIVAAAVANPVLMAVLERTREFGIMLAVGPG